MPVPVAGPEPSFQMDGAKRPRLGVDAALTLLLCVQALTTFVVIPLSAGHPAARSFLDASHVAFAVICIGALVRGPILRLALLCAMAFLLCAPRLQERFAISATTPLFFEATVSLAFVFNAIVTTVVTRHVFGPGRVTAHRLQGGVLIYLNVAALFSIAYLAVTMIEPSAITSSIGDALPDEIGAKVASLTYFSLTTITTTGYGDYLPVHPIARSLANLESVFGHLFPATLLARLVALHVAHRLE